MFLQRIVTPGLAHFSYVMGDGDAAAVVDPRRDIAEYIDVARRHGATVRLVFETHRNEDLVSGASLLAAATGADVFHGRQLDFEYGRAVEDGQTFELAGLKLKVLETPGHTDESLSVVIYAPDSPDHAWGVCTGDALFMGGVGRTDFHPERAEDDAAALWDSLHSKLLPLGDQTLLFPAHGAGSACGQGLAERPSATIGYERATSPLLQLDRDAFVRAKLDERHTKPPYFARMEQTNLRGGAPAATTAPALLSAAAVADRREDGAILVDVRSAEAFAAANIPGSVSLPRGLLCSYAGWFVDPDDRVVLIADRAEDAEAARRDLSRIGYDRVIGQLSGGMTAWETAGRALARLQPLSASEVDAMLDAPTPPMLLDVRTADEFEAGHPPGARHLYLGQVPAAVPQLPRDRSIVTFCGSGQRASIAASLLSRAGFDRVGVCFGSMKAWSARGLPVVEAR